jgi:MerR family transcriptional regulator, light-induced transcriptional regulator
MPRESMNNPEIGRTIESTRQDMAEAVVDRQYLLNPELESRFGAKGRQKCVADTCRHLAYLAQAIASSRPALFRDYVAWAKVLLAGHGVPADDFAYNLYATTLVLKDRLHADAGAIACSYVDAALNELPQMPETLASAIIPGMPLTLLAESYLAALLACERNKAGKLVLDAVKSGVSIKDIYIHVFQQSQQEMGRLWQSNKVSVAQEHYCTAATQMIMSQLYAQIFAGPRNGRRFVGASVTGDLHEIGIRMVADFFEMDGWDTVFLGSSVPSADLVKTLQDRKPSVVGISATLTPHVAAVVKMIGAIRAAPGCENVKILVGGYPFLIVPDLWKQVGADGTCQSAQAAVDLANELIQQRKAA